MKLNFKKLGKGEPVIILHGIFGSLDNWLTVGKMLAEHFLVYLVDQRNHGQSPHSQDFTYAHMEEDLLELLADEELTSCRLIGHSMGGKTAMNFAVHHKDMVRKLVVVDIAPKPYAPHHQQIFRGFGSVDLKSIDSRKKADEQLSAVIEDVGVRQFLLKNLAREGQEGFRWKLNLEAIEENIGEVGKGLEKEDRFEGPTLFLRGENSDYIESSDDKVIKKHFPEAQIVTIKNAGHWIHAEQPQALHQTVKAFLE